MLFLSFTAVSPFFSSSQRHLPKSFGQPRRPRYFTMHSTPQTVLRGTILVTNDDGISPRTGLALSLAQALASVGHDVTVLAPSSNRSACGHGITLFRSLSLRRHPSLEAAYSVAANNGSESSGEIRVFSLDGTPADCVAAAVEPETGVLARLGLQARAVVSGVNLGPNLGADVLYSGTVAAARQAAMYGVPGVAASLGDASNLSAHGEAFAERAAAGALRAVVRIVTGVLQAAESPAASGNGVTGIRERCAQGDIFVNVNVPGKWNGRYRATKLDDVKYFDVVRMEKLPENENEEATLTFSGGRREAREAHDSDGWAVKEGFCAVSTLQTWPWSHPRFVPNAEIESAMNMGIDGLPLWLAQVGDVYEKEQIVTQMPTYREVEGVANERS